MDPKCSGCPITGECDSYAVLCNNHAKSPEKWRRVIDRHNGVEPEYPPLLEQVGSLAVAVGTFIKSGCATVDQAEFDRRHAICETCESFDAKRNKCRECRCSMAVKPWGRDMECPLGKWSDDGGI
ncbi:MAG: hypothetical protein P4L67_04795 [Candidatus Pacebacteria bacterium]|nr:hypothetical protein [Candidatus Paceibacterota bacterium]